jgi:C-terminal processing protease CtpA/Prc
MKMETTKKFSKVIPIIMLVISAMLCASCTTTPGRVEAINSASPNCRNIIGIELCNLTNEQRAATRYEREGVYVCAVIPNHPAYLAGLRGGDIIKSINSIPVSNISEALTIINDLEAGRSYPFRIYRVKTKPSALMYSVFETVTLTFYILVEKVQERAIGRIS